MKTVGKDIKYKFCHVGRISFSPDDDDDDDDDDNN
jgi:hypothetical protein